MRCDVSIGFDLLGTDYYAEVTVNVTSMPHKGSPPSFDDPGEAPSGAEFWVEHIDLYEDTPKKTGALLEVPKWLEALIENSDELSSEVNDACCRRDD
jgi:hypothetical protein